MQLIVSYEFYIKKLFLVFVVQINLVNIKICIFSHFNKI